MLEENIASFLDYFHSLSYSEKSLKSLKSRLGEFKVYINRLGLQAPSKITYQHLLDFVTGEEETSLHVTKSRVWALKQFFQYLMLQNILSDNLAKDLPYPKMEKKVPLFLSGDEFQQLLTYLCERIDEADGLRNLIIFLLMGVLGLRVSTVSALNVVDVEVSSARLWVTEKGGVQRFMILSPSLVNLLECYLATHPHTHQALFLSRCGKRLSVSALQKLVAQVGNACLLSTGLYPHIFRHTAATHLSQVADISITREVLGHWREGNTRRYVHLGSHLYAQYMRRHPFMRV